MKLVREHINEAKIGDILKPLSQEQILDEIRHMSQEEKDKKLLNACLYGSVDTAKILINNGANVNAKDNGGNTSLFWAGANVNIKNNKFSGSDTALMLASRYGLKNIIELLLKAGADVNAKNYNGWTALMWASTNGRTNVVELLLKAGADVNVKNNDDKTALKLALIRNYIDIANLLKQYGAK